MFKQIILNTERVKYWLDNGAIPSDTVSQILLRQGIKTKYAEQTTARRAKAKAQARAKGKFFNKAEKIAAEKTVEKAKAEAAAAEEKAKAEKVKAEAAESQEAEAQAPVEEEKPERIVKKDGLKLLPVEKGAYRVKNGKVEKYVAMLDFSKDETLEVFRRYLKKEGIEGFLAEKGVRTGDTVIIGEMEFIYEKED